LYRACCLITLWIVFSWSRPLTGDDRPWPATSQAAVGMPSAGGLANERPLDLVELQAWIGKLGSNNYHQRRVAFLELWRVGRQHRDVIRPILEQAALDSDLEKSVAIRWLQILIRLSAEPAEVASLLKDLALVRSGDLQTLLRLASDSRWDHLESMLEILSPTERQKLLEDLPETASPLIKLLALAWNDQQEIRLPRLIDRLYPLDQAVRARRTWHALGLESLAQQPLLLAEEAPLSQQFTEILALEQAGKVEAAIALAHRCAQGDFAYALAVEHQAWPQALWLLDEQRTGANRVMPERIDTVSLKQLSITQAPRPASLRRGGEALEAARIALIWRWLGDEPRSQAWADSLGPPEPSEQELTSHLTSLALVGRLDEAIAIAKERDSPAAYDILVAQGRIEEAFACLGLADREEDTVRRWLDGELGKTPKDRREDFELTSRLASLGCLLYRLGERQAGELVDEAVIHWISGSGEAHKQDIEAKLGRSISDVVRDRWRVATWVWTTQHRRRFALDKFAQLLREGIDDDHRNGILFTLYWRKEGFLDLGPQAASMLDWLHRARRQRDWVQALNDLEAVAAGRSPEDWPDDWQQEGFPSMGQALINDADAEELPGLTLALSRMATKLHRTDLATDWLLWSASPGFRDWYRTLRTDALPMRATGPRQSASDDFVERLEVLGEILSAEHHYTNAAFVHHWLWELDPGRLELAMKAASYYRLIGDSEAAQRLELQASSLPLSDEQWREAAAKMDAEKLHQPAIHFSRLALLSHDAARMEDWQATAILVSARQSLIDDSFRRWAEARRGLELKDERSSAEASPDPASWREFWDEPTLESFEQAYREYQRLWLSRLASQASRSDDFQLKYILPELEGLERSRARLAIVAGDFSAADAAIRRCHTVHPDQIETLIELLPLGEVEFGWERVEPWLALYVEPMERHLARWPDDTLVGNNLAWLYANVERRLERAQAISQHVVELLPQDHVYLDTLAEIEHRLGHRDRAVELSTTCRRLAPLEEHHRQQLHRFLAWPGAGKGVRTQ
jgi:hypothetical protein